MLKSYDELRKIDVLPYCEKRDGNDYLNWAKCIDLLHENGAEKVYFTPLTNPNGSSLFMSDMTFSDKNEITNRCYEVRINVVIDDMNFDVQAPLMNGSNPVKDNSMSQQRVWNAQTRAFVKGVAIHTGLGFGLWLNDAEGKITEDDLSRHNILSVMTRVQMLITSKMQQGGYSKPELAKALGMNEKEIGKILGWYSALDKFEKAIQKL